MGCLRSLVTRIGCLLVLVALAFFGWVYREQTMDVVRRLRGLPPKADRQPAQPERDTSHDERRLRQREDVDRDVAGAEAKQQAEFEPVGLGRMLHGVRAS